MQQRRYKRLHFWISATAAFCLCIFALNHVERNATYVHKRKFPELTNVFIAAYKRGNSEHYIFLNGLFGTGNRIKHSEVLLAGSSHMEFGVSAGELGRYLSQSFKREIKVYNIAVGFVDGPPFARLILAGNDVSDAGIVIDGFAPFGDDLSGFAKMVASKDIFTSYVDVLENWADFLRDWTLDGVLPRFELQAGPEWSDVRLVQKRFLQWTATLRRWDTGDLVSCWDPKRGEICDKPDSDVIPELWPPQPIIPTPMGIGPFLVQHGLIPVLTLIPYKGYDSADTELTASDIGWDYLPITVENLKFVDEGRHVTALTRSRITQQVAQELQQTRIGTLLNRRSRIDKPR